MSEKISELQKYDTDALVRGKIQMVCKALKKYQENYKKFEKESNFYKESQLLGEDATKFIIKNPSTTIRVDGMLYTKKLIRSKNKGR